jgi:hypothetical protein
MNRIRIFTIPLLVLAFNVFIGCIANATPVLPPIDYILVITDSIGVEAGDSCYMFHLPVDVAFSPEGNIAVLDKLKHKAFIFTSDGEFIGTVGREGDGPGEFRLPSSIQFNAKGEFFIQDQRSIAVFDSDFMYVDQMTWSRYPPYMVRAFDDRSLVGTLGWFLPGENGIINTDTLGCWGNNGSLSVVYASIAIEFDPGDNTLDRTETREGTIYCCATESGRVFYSQSSVDEFIVTGFEPDGTEFLRIVDPGFSRVRKTDQEMQAEIDWFDSFRAYAGSQRDIGLKPDPFRRAILGMFTIGEDELWVRLGFYEEVVFRVYDMAGKVRYHVMLDYPGDPADLINWEVSGSEHGFLAYETMPEYYPMIYLLELVSAEDTDLTEI